MKKAKKCFKYRVTPYDYNIIKNDLFPKMEDWDIDKAHQYSQDFWCL